MKYYESRILRNFPLSGRSLALVLLMLFGTLSQSFAADAVAGKALFEANCTRCHSGNLQNDLTGPALYGVQGRLEAGGVTNQVLYQWIRNSASVRDKDPYFIKVFAKWKTNMDAMPDLTDENIDNILEYIYTWEPPAPVPGEGPTQTNAADDPTISSMWSWMRFLILVILALLGNIALQVARLRGVELFAGINLDKWNGRIMLGFMVIGLTGAIWSSYAYSDTFLLKDSASEHGSAIDRMFWITMAVTFSVFVFTNILLFWFSYKYSQDPNRKAKYYPENHKLEMIWTAVPAVVLTILVVFGIKTWNNVMGAPPEGEEVVNIAIHGYQFGWTIHYAGPDGKLGESNVHRMSGDNLLGLDFTKPESRDDFISGDLVLPQGKRVVLRISSQDVLHSVYLPHFRVKMDAVPGMNTRFHFVPVITTDSMRVIRQDTNFVYELACAEVCGKGHFSMRKVVDVKDQAGYDAWFSKASGSPLYNAEIHGTELISDPAAIKPSTGLTAENKEY